MMKKNISRLNEKIERFETKYRSKNKNKNSNINIGLKFSLELISPIIMGILIGIGCDKFFSTKPIFFLIFLLLGIIAGFWNIFKSVNRLK